MLDLNVIDIMLVLLLAVVGALVIWLHLRLNALSGAVRHEKELSKTLDLSLEKARLAIGELMEASKTHGPELQNHIQKAQSILQDFDFVMGRAEKILQNFDNKNDSYAHQLENIARMPEKIQLSTPNVSSQPTSAVNQKKKTEKESERSVLLGQDLEQVLTQKQEKLEKNRKEDIRSTFVKAMEEREKRIEKQNISYPDKVETLSGKDLDFLDGMKKTAPRGFGAQAYASETPSDDEMADIRRVLEAH